MDSTEKYDLRDRIKIITGAFGLDVHYHSEEGQYFLFTVI